VGVIERAWHEASLDWHDELGAALVRELDEGDAMTAIRVVRKFCVPAPSYQGAVDLLREVEGKLGDATRSTRHGNSGVANTLVAEALALIRERGR
jgi:hypothetical protein